MAKTSNAKASLVTCSLCGMDVPDHMDRCPACGDDIGSPNVRAAEKQEEIDALERRYQDAVTSAQGRGCKDIVEKFRTAVSSSQAVLCAKISEVFRYASSDNQLYATFHQDVDALSRLPEKNKWDSGREGRDATLFPYYFKKIHFAVLSLDGTGATGYGDFALLLKETMINRRATVFEENNALFILRNKIIAGEPIPPGYRTTWNNRDRLAVAKLANRIRPDTEPDSFASILREGTGKTDSDSIEVHVYGTMHRNTIERITIKEPKRRADKVIIRSIISKLREKGVEVEIDK